MLGGLPRKSQKIDDLRKNEPAPVLLVDAGNVLFNGEVITGERSLMVGEAIAAAYQVMGYDAVAVGPYDLAAGPEFLRRAEQWGIPWVSANLQDRDGNLLCMPYRIVDRDGLSVAFIGLTGQPATQEHEVVVDLDPDAVLEPLIYDLHARHDLLVLLSSLPHEQSMQIAERHPEIAVVIGADPQRATIPGLRTGGAIAAQTGNRGMYLGVLRAQWTGAPWGEDVALERARLVERLTSINWQLQRITTQRDGNRQQQRRLETLEAARTSTQAELSRIEEPGGRDDERRQPSTYQIVQLPLTGSLASDQKIVEIIQKNRQRIDLLRP